MKTRFKTSTMRSIIRVNEDPYCAAEPLQHACELVSLGLTGESSVLPCSSR